MPKLTRTNFSVKHLIDMYSDGEIAIPEIQRDFVWDAQRIRKLLDSLQKDFPSGAIILWRPEFRVRSEFEMLIRPERLHLYKKRLPTYLLLDGQQRLTALCSVILPTGHVLESLGEEIDLPNLFINLKTLEIEARKDSSPPSNNDVLLNRILSAETDDSGLSSVLSAVASRKDILARHRNGLKEFREKILQYDYPVQILENHDYATVAEIFRRVNSQGKVLVTAEIELAKIVPHWKGFAKHLRIFIREMRGEGFNADMPFYMKCLAFIATDWPPIEFFSKSIEKDSKKYSKRKLEGYWSATKTAIRKLHTLLRRNKIDRTELITSRNASVPMVYALAKDRNNRIGDTLFIKWLIYSMIGGHYAQRTEGVLRKDSYPMTESLPKVEKGFAKMYRQMIKKHWYSTTFSEAEFKGTPSKNPSMLSIYLGLQHNGARDFAGKHASPINEISKYQIHHIFPIEFMLSDDDAERYRKRNGLSRPNFKDQINDVANLTFISLGANQEIKKRPPMDYLQKLTTPENLEAHCIPKNSELWKPQNFGKFCVERRRLLARAMNSYLRHIA